MKVLIVDGDPSSRTDIVALLESAGHVVFSAETGERALEILELTSFDAAVLDLGLPCLSGASVALRMRTHPEWRSIPIILLGGYSGDATREHGPIDRRVSVTPHFGKPVDGNRLLMTLQRIDEARH